MLEAKVDIDRRLALIPLTDGEREAIEQDRQALDRLLEGLADIRPFGSSGTESSIQIARAAAVAAPDPQRSFVPLAAWRRVIPPSG